MSGVMLDGLRSPPLVREPKATTAVATPATTTIADPSTRFTAMVTDHFDFVWRLLRGLGVAPDAVDDAAQHVFLVASNKVAAIAYGSERSFLFGTAVGVAANVRRSQ